MAECESPYQYAKDYGNCCEDLVIPEPPLVQMGTVIKSLFTFPIGAPLGPTSTTRVVVFPIPYASAPNIICSFSNIEANTGGSAGTNMNFTCEIQTVNATQFTVRVRTVTGEIMEGAIVSWVAVGTAA